MAALDPRAAFSLDGRVAVVTAAGAGIGRAIAQSFALAGARVFVADIDGEGAEETARLIGAAATPVQTDVTDAAAMEALAESARTVGPIGVWVNGVGVADLPLPIVDTSAAMFDRIFTVNVRSMFLACGIAARAMTASGGGSIINLSSGAGDGPVPGLGTYAMSKAAVNLLTQTLAAECGPSGVRVNGIAPGSVHTPEMENRLLAMQGRFDQSLLDAHLATIAAAAPLRRYGETSDIAMAALYLASDASRHVTGQTLRINGGTAMR